MGLIMNLMNDPAMRAFGHLAGLVILFNSIMTSTALYSSGTWINMTKGMYDKYDREQKRILYNMLKICQKTTFLHVCWELDILPWSYGIMKEKINLVSFLCHEKVGEAARMAVSEASRNWKPGLLAEVRRCCLKWNLPDPSKTPLSKETVSERIIDVAREEIYASLVSGKYLNMELGQVKNFPSYIYAEELSSHQQKIVFCYRLGILCFTNRFSHNYSNVNVNCIYRGCDQDDILDHSFYCAWNRVV